MKNMIRAATAALAMSAVGASAEPFKCPRVGGDFVFGQEANVNSLDQMTSQTISTRNIAMNMFETLMTRDENNNPILELAESMTEAPDRLSYTFKLRQGIRFHNGKPMTSADVAESTRARSALSARPAISIIGKPCGKITTTRAASLASFSIC